MAGFETPKYTPPRDPLRGVEPATNKKPWGGLGTERGLQDKINKNWLENLGGMQGHIQTTPKLTPAEENENMIRGNINSDLHGDWEWDNKKFLLKENLPLPPELQPPDDHPIRKMALPPAARRLKAHDLKMPFPGPARNPFMPVNKGEPKKPLGPWKPWNK
tara:strand:- start:757 stop:1239 length:483 start_codon:yes stop_codon:yes gene_type:complete